MRRTSSLDFERSLAMLALAGIREMLQAQHVATAGADTAYTVAGDLTRRVMFFHLGLGANDVCVRYNAVAAATHMPVTPQTYFVFDAKKGDTIHFWNTTVNNITINVMELA